jgi:hypothetical protein
MLLFLLSFTKQNQLSIRRGHKTGEQQTSFAIASMKSYR